jgi:hypothetical protein
MRYNLYLSSENGISEDAVSRGTVVYHNINWDMLLPQNPQLANKEQMYELTVACYGEYIDDDDPVSNHIA